MRPELVARPTDSVKVTLSDGVERTLRYTFRSLRLAKEEFGGSITSLETLKKLDEDNIGKLIWYGLKADDPAVTVEQVEDLFDPTMVSYLMGKFVQAISAGMPEAKNGQSEQATPETETSTGSPSGPSEESTSDSLTATSGA